MCFNISQTFSILPFCLSIITCFSLSISFFFIPTFRCLLHALLFSSYTIFFAIATGCLWFHLIELRQLCFFSFWLCFSLFSDSPILYSVLLLLLPLFLLHPSPAPLLAPSFWFCLLACLSAAAHSFIRYGRAATKRELPPFCAL